MSRNGGKSARSASSTWRALADSGSTWASTDVNWMLKNGIPRTISSAALAAAIRPGKRITSCESRYQNPSWAGRASRSARRLRNAGARALTRSPSSASTAGSTISAIAAAIRATIEPPMPIEYKKRCGKTISEAIAPATVSALNSTVRPAVAIVRRIASMPGPRLAISSR